MLVKTVEFGQQHNVLDIYLCLGYKEAVTEKHAFREMKILLKGKM